MLPLLFEFTRLARSLRSPKGLNIRVGYLALISLNFSDDFVCLASCSKKSHAAPKRALLGCFASRTSSRASNISGALARRDYVIFHIIEGLKRCIHPGAHAQANARRSCRVQSYLLGFKLLLLSASREFYLHPLSPMSPDDLELSLQRPSLTLNSCKDKLRSSGLRD